MAFKDMGVSGKEAQEARKRMVEGLKDVSSCKKRACNDKPSDEEKKQMDECLGKSSCKEFSACMKKYAK